MAADIRTTGQVDVSEFRENLDHFLDATAAVRITRDGEIVGVFTPVPRPKKFAAEEADKHWAKYSELQQKLLAQMEKRGVTEEDLIRDIEELQRQKRERRP